MDNHISLFDDKSHLEELAIRKIKKTHAKIRMPVSLILDSLHVFFKNHWHLGRYVDFTQVKDLEVQELKLCDAPELIGPILKYMPDIERLKLILDTQAIEFGIYLHFWKLQEFRTPLDYLWM